MKIGEIAAHFRVSVKAIRLYEKKGIVKPAKIDPQTGYRYYTTDQIHQINALLELKALGFSLAEIKSILQGGASDAQLMEGLARKRMAWQNAVAMAEHKMDAIDRMLERIGQSKEAVALQCLTDEDRAWLLVKMVCVGGVWMPSELSEALWL